MCGLSERVGEGACDSIRYFVGCSFDRIGLQVSIPGGRLNLGMSQQAADHRQVLAEL